MPVSYSKLIKKALENIDHDRHKAKLLLEEALVVMYGCDNEQKKTGFIRDAGVVVSKYLEVLQKSNEQLVKILSIEKKNIRPEQEELDNTDIRQIFDSLEEKKPDGGQ